MDFVIGLLRTSKDHEAIWVIVDRLTKSAHFLPVRMTYDIDKFAQFYIGAIVRLHGIPILAESVESYGHEAAFQYRLSPSDRWITLIRELIRVAQNRQKSNADNRRKDLELDKGDMVFLRVAPMKGVMRQALPPAMKNIHNTFHVSMLKKYVHDPSHTLNYEPLDLKVDMTYEEKPVQILDRKDQVLRNRSIPLVKVLWRNHAIEEASWEWEEDIRAKYPEIFTN
ncbi:uncharacterized protein LOC122650618 [Telopea speciosissima]|uniref:uncharacterized protein LOC122650618 n=1 Tax=Telopea speciosissima TaxID=54955 RepID=UPI001CC5EDC1|nr:uncharacterized protein LOC122650618 [Telopea speciosissima]